LNIDGTPLGNPATITGGQATFTTSTLSAGVHQITATYSGDSNDLGSTSSALTQTVNHDVTTTTQDPRDAIWQQFQNIHQWHNVRFDHVDRARYYLNDAINKINSADNDKAKQDLDDYIGWANSLAGKDITTSQAAQLISQAQSIENNIH